MKKSKFFKYAVAALLTMSASVTSAATLKVGTGSESGNYFAMGQDIQDYCQPELSQDSIEPMSSTGSVDNLAGMQTKKFAMGMVQEDVLRYYAKRTPGKVNENRVKVITALHVEAMHLLIPKGYEPKGSKGNFFTSFFSDDKPQKLDINLLKGQVISAWGGSIVSAEALSSFFGLNAKVTEIKEGAMSKNPIIIVSGYPSAVVESYLETGKYNLVSMDFDVVRQRAPFYTEEFLNYSINGKMKSIPTIGVRALLIGKSFRREDRNITASELSTCIEEYLADLADDPSTNPNWASVYDYVENGGQVAWKYFPLLK